MIQRVALRFPDFRGEPHLGIHENLPCPKESHTPDHHVARDEGRDLTGSRTVIPRHAQSGLVN